MDAPDNDDAISLPSDAASLPSDALSLRSEVVDPSLPSDKDSEPSQDDALAPPQRHWRHSDDVARGEARPDDDSAGEQQQRAQLRQPVA